MMKNLKVRFQTQSIEYLKEIDNLNKILNKSFILND